MANKIKYINPLTGFGFKRVFGNEDIMCDFLNDIIEPIINNEADFTIGSRFIKRSMNVA